MAPTFLGIESSCDDTAAAVVRGDGTILSSVVAGQTALHADFGGVVPEIAARAHAEKLDLCVEQALEQAGVTLDALDGIAVTAGPGLIGGVLSGVMLAKGLAAGSGLPLVGVNMFLPKEHAGEIATEIELIRSTEEEKGQQIENVRNWQEGRNALAPKGETSHAHQADADEQAPDRKSVV